jgi:pilus assembly protein CpaD
MRKLHLFSLAALGLSLSACGGTSNQGLESAHQPVVSRTDFVYDVNDGMGAQGSQRLAAWFESLSVGFGDRISVDDPTGNPSNRTLVAAAASRFGLIVQDTAPVTQGEITPGSFRVVVSRTKADVPGCPDWSRSSVGNYTGDAPSNFGCATNANLAATIANPNDLIGDGHQTKTTNSNYFTTSIRKPVAK